MGGSREWMRIASWRGSGRLRSDLIDPTIALHHGRAVKRTGDGSLIEFRSVVDAVRCALEVQHAMVERNAGVALDPGFSIRRFSTGGQVGDRMLDAMRKAGVPEG